MKKIISLFQRNYDGNRLVRDEVVPGAEWVLEGEGLPTRKWDGTCCMIEEGKVFKRYDAKHGKQPPVGFIPAQDPDPETGHWPGWLLVGNGPEDRWFKEGFTMTQKFQNELLENGTYELVGPKVNNNPEHFDKHIFIPHGKEVLDVSTPRTFEGLKKYFEVVDIEGIVWHHADGRMVKIKKRDFGYHRNK